MLFNRELTTDARQYLERQTAGIKRSMRNQRIWLITYSILAGCVLLIATWHEHIPLGWLWTSAYLATALAVSIYWGWRFQEILSRELFAHVADVFEHSNYVMRVMEGNIGDLGAYPRPLRRFVDPAYRDGAKISFRQQFGQMVFLYSYFAAAFGYDPYPARHKIVERALMVLGIIGFAVFLGGNLSLILPINFLPRVVGLAGMIGLYQVVAFVMCSRNTEMHVVATLLANTLLDEDLRTAKVGVG